MSTAFHHPLSIAIEKVRFVPDLHEHSIHALHLRYSESEQASPLFIRGVHLPPSIQRAFEAGEVKSLYVETIQEGSPTWALLPRHPTHIVTCVVLENGQRLREAPLCIPKKRQQLLGLAGLSAVAGSVFLTYGAGALAAWTGAAALLAAHAWHRKARGLPRMEFSASSVTHPKQDAPRYGIFQAKGQPPRPEGWTDDDETRAAREHFSALDAREQKMIRAFTIGLACVCIAGAAALWLR